MLGNTTGNRNVCHLRWVVLARWEMGEFLGFFSPILTLLGWLLRQEYSLEALVAPPVEHQLAGAGLQPCSGLGRR